MSLRRILLLRSASGNPVPDADHIAHTNGRQYAAVIIMSDNASVRGELLLYVALIYS
jgi:hypothetical protein